jgi:hypothetical protein
VLHSGERKLRGERLWKKVPGGWPQELTQWLQCNLGRDNIMGPQVFISYAHRDNQPYGKEEKGWVTNFVENLQKALSMRKDCKDVRCWMDHRLEPQRAVDDTLRQRILESKCIIAFMSPSYLESEWCRKEMDTFVALVGGGTASNRVFLVELLPTSRESWHSGVHSIGEIRFWTEELNEPEAMILGWPVPDTTKHEQYWSKLNSLAAILARQIQDLPPTSPPAADAAAGIPRATPAAAAKVIWIADPTDDVLDCWESLAATLLGRGHSVLPEAAGCYPYREEAPCRQALKSDLVRADLLVQLLGSLSGRKPAWADARFVQIQAEAAKAEVQRRSVPLLTWRDPDVSLDALTDPVYKALLAEATASDFQAFCQQVIDRIIFPPAPVIPPPASEALSLVVNADKPDRDLGQRVQDILGDLEVEATLAAEPLPTQVPAQYYEQLEAQLGGSHGVLIVYGDAPPSWVQAQHALARKVLAVRRKGIWGAVLEGPPEEKPDLGLGKRSLSNLLVLNCRRGLCRGPLERFVATLRRGVAHV